MTDHPLDPARDRLVAALLGELAVDERAELERQLAADDTLRRDRDELELGRRAAAAAAAATRPGADDFAFAWPPEPARPRRGLGHTLLAVAAGFLLAALTFSALLLLGLRLDRSGGALVIGFAAPTEPAAAAGDALLAALPTATEPPLSRAELAAGLDAVLQVTAVRFAALERRQAETQAVISRSLYDALSSNQLRQTEALSTEIRLAVLDGGASRWPQRARPSTGFVNPSDDQPGDFPHDGLPKGEFQ
jgi:hypothetical protein